MTILYNQGDGLVGERVIAYARRIEVMKTLMLRTHRHRAQAAKMDNVECYIIKPLRWKGFEKKPDHIG